MKFFDAAKEKLPVSGKIAKDFERLNTHNSNSPEKFFLFYLYPRFR